MRTIRSLIFAGGVASILAFAGSAYASDAVTVEVTLTDKGAEAGVTEGHGMAMNGTGEPTMSITVAPGEVKAGEIKFNVTNSSKDTVHEFVVAKLDDPSQLLPYKDADKEVDEDKMANVGEIEDIDAGKSGSVNFDLKAGTYILYCNIAGHYSSGMWALLKVTE